ncbi:endopeptidase La [bacterium]|nr:MAG: endopeptidase La [bacterium]QQR61686.1 MAG: endopeptidase La [bacterium]
MAAIEEQIVQGPKKVGEIPKPDTTSVENKLPLLPLKNVVILPKTVIPIIAGRDLSIEAVEYALKHDRNVFITTQKDAKTEIPTKDDLYIVGTRATILQVARMPNGNLKVLTEGICRSQMLDLYDTGPFLSVTCQDIPTIGLEYTIELEAAWRELCSLYAIYTQYNEKAPADLTSMVKTPSDMDHITDTIAIQINTLGYTDRQNILEIPALTPRIIAVCKSLKKEIDIVKIEQKIHGHIQNQVEKNQREYYLTEQIKAIQKELGRDDQSAEIDAMRSKIKKLQLPKDAKEKVEKELKRLEQMQPLSSEAVVSRNYIDWILSLPWSKESKDSVSINEAIKILDKNHSGLKKLKERIVEFLAAKKYSQNMSKSPIICFVGPPGVGKTSLAVSIAEALGREFVRIALGGVRDEAEIRGHRRTYIGALPGKIIQAMKRAKTINPVILLDEIDKMSRDVHGDPAAGLLEVLDPEQNKTFMDHFLDTEYDLSKVMFITTANMLENIPYALLDRLDVIQLSGYTEEEKIDIAESFLIPRNLKEYGLSKNNFHLARNLLQMIVEEYTKEAGVRQLDRVLAKLMRKVIQLLLESKKVGKQFLTIEKIREWLGNPPFKKTSLNQAKKRIGLAIGLAWTEVGGDVLEIEAAALQGKGTINLTGQLGEVMQESAHAALSYIRSRSKNLGLNANFHNQKDIHVHIPEGATPKDGPSAGITICTALISSLTENPAKEALAMTGEITLQGRVLAIGGLKEKLISAKQHGIKTVIVPSENHDDLLEIKKEVDFADLEIKEVNTMDDVLKIALEKDPFILKKRTTKKTAVSSIVSTAKKQERQKSLALKRRK